MGYNVMVRINITWSEIKFNQSEFMLNDDRC